jgi:hypothetical protein
MRVAKVGFAFRQRAVRETCSSPGSRGQLHRHAVPVPDEQRKLLEDLCSGRVRHGARCATGAHERQRANDEIAGPGESARKACLRSRRTAFDRTTRTLPALLDRVAPGRAREERNHRRRHRGAHDQYAAPSGHRKQYTCDSAAVPQMSSSAAAGLCRPRYCSRSPDNPNGRDEMSPLMTRSSIGRQTGILPTPGLEKPLA